MERHYVLTTIGSLGRASFLEAELSAYHEVIRLFGFPRGTASSLFQECYAMAKQNQIDADLIHNALDDSLEGILFPGIGTGVINLPIYEPRFDVASVFKNDAVMTMDKKLKQAQHSFAEARKIHDDWEKIYISSTDYDALNRLTDDFISRLLVDKKTDYPGLFYDRFFGAATVNGPVNYIETLTQHMKRYFMKGRPGTGKSTFLKKIAQAAKDRGFRVERYHCAFDPNSLDMVIIKELNLCIFDATSPHEYFPSQDTDEVLDLYESAVAPHTDEANQAQLDHLSNRYKNAIAEATKQLIAANEACKQAEEIYWSMMSPDLVMELRQRIHKHIFI